MRQAFAHDAVLVMASSGNIQAPGAAVTVALCGHWEHDPPCPLAAHHTDARRTGDEVRLRILFATEPSSESVVRQRIDQALADGHLRGPDGMTTTWQLRGSQRSDLTPDETDHAARLATG
jgi:hypothetical protein